MDIYTLNIHYKQGDDLHHFLEINDGDSKKALKAWAKSLRAGADIIDELVKNFNRKELTIDQADTHYIAISGDAECLKKSCEQGILDKDEFDDETEEFEEDDDDGMEDDIIEKDGEDLLDDEEELSDEDLNDCFNCGACKEVEDAMDQKDMEKFDKK